jgi:hypothetical protein
MFLILQVRVPLLTSLSELDQSNYVHADILRKCWLYDLLAININFSLIVNFLILAVSGNILGVMLCHSAYKCLLRGIEIYEEYSGHYLNEKNKFTIELLCCKSTNTHYGTSKGVGIQFH